MGYETEKFTSPNKVWLVLGGKTGADCEYSQKCYYSLTY
jgi:hypothetical protein